MKHSKIFLLILALLLTAFASPLKTHASPTVTATVRVDTLNVRKAPRATYPIIGQLVRDEEVTLIGRNGAATWLEASTRFGVGWINAQFILASDSIGVLPVTENDVSPFVTVVVFPGIVVRSGPSTQFPALGLLFTGSSADVIGADARGTWLQISAFNGGWIQAQFVAVTGTMRAIPDSSGSATPVARSVVYRLRVRAAPDLTSDTVGVMAQNEYAYIIGTNARHNFWKVQGAFGTGWVSAQFVLATGNLEAVPVVQ